MYCSSHFKYIGYPPASLMKLKDSAPLPGADDIKVASQISIDLDKSLSALKSDVKYFGCKPVGV